MWFTYKYVNSEPVFLVTCALVRVVSYEARDGPNGRKSAHRPYTGMASLLCVYECAALIHLISQNATGNLENDTCMVFHLKNINQSIFITMLFKTYQNLLRYLATYNHHFEFNQ